MASRETYRHLQVGTGLLVVAGLIVVVCIVIGGWVSSHHKGSPGFWLVFFLPSGLIALLTIVFSRFETRVSDDTVSWAFGVGFPRYSVSLYEVRAVRPVRIGWWVGAGVHTTPSGMLYNVGGPDAVEMTLTDRRVLVGTDVPEELAAAIARAQLTLDRPSSGLIA